MKFPLKFILCLFKFVHALAEAASEFWKFFGPEENENEEHDDHDFGPARCGKCEE